MRSRIMLSLLAAGVGFLMGYAASTGKLFSLQARQQPGPEKLDRSVLPIRDTPFQGVAKRTLDGSKLNFPLTVTPLQDAPNVFYGFPVPAAERTKFTYYPGMENISSGMIPNIHNRFEP